MSHHYNNSGGRRSAGGSDRDDWCSSYGGAPSPEAMWYASQGHMPMTDSTEKKSSSSGKKSSSRSSGSMGSADHAASRRRHRLIPSLPEGLKQLSFVNNQDDMKKPSARHFDYDQNSDSFSVAQETVTTAASTVDGTLASGYSTSGYSTSGYSTSGYSTSNRTNPNSSRGYHSSDAMDHYYRSHYDDAHDNWSAAGTYYHHDVHSLSAAYPATISSGLPAMAAGAGNIGAQDLDLARYDPRYRMTEPSYYYTPPPAAPAVVSKTSLPPRDSEFSPSILSFGQFSADAIQSQLPNCQAVLLEAETLPTMDSVYRMMTSPELLTPQWMEQIQLVSVSITKYQLRRVIEDSRQAESTLSYMCTTTQWSAEWEQVFEDDTELLNVALPRLLLMRTDVPSVQCIVDMLCNMGRYPSTSTWIPGVLMVLRNLCQMQGVPMIDYQYESYTSAPFDF